MRIVPDLRRVYLALEKGEIPLLTTPTIHQIATRAIQLSWQFPDTEIMLCKRDIAKASKLTPVNPHLMRCLFHVSKAPSSGTSSDIVGCFPSPHLDGLRPHRFLG